MLLISVALKVEALPIIEHFKLKSLHDNKYNIYLSDDIALIITGIGKINASVGTTYLAMKYLNDMKAFLNIGIAGHGSLELGTCILAHKIIDEGSKKELFPSILFDMDFLTKDLITVDKSIDLYEEDFVYDMECFGFFKAASKFSYFDLIHSLKIISDNEKSSFKNLTSDIVKNLIYQNIKTIEKIINDINNLLKKIKPKIDYPVKKFLEMFHITESEEYQLKNILWKIHCLDSTFSLEKLDLRNFKNKKELFFHLEKLYKNLKLIL